MSNLANIEWSFEKLNDLYRLPLIELLSQAHQIHLKHHRLGEVQVCSLINIKTGGCQEDCKYCAQSSRYQTAVTAQPLMKYDEVMSEAKKAVASGATRICLGAAWRGLRDNRQFDEILKMITGISELGAEVCCTLGLLQPHQAQRLKEAGLYAYNHNLDTSEEYYKTIITTRTYKDRLDTLDIIEQTGISVCCGGILGLGESVDDRLNLLLTLSKRNPHPGSVPINILKGIAGTPLENQAPVPIWEFLRMIAIARIIMPNTMVRLSCGRSDFSFQEQALCFFAGANSIHSGEKLLTIGNTPVDRDHEMFEILGLTKRPAYLERLENATCC